VRRHIPPAKPIAIAICAGSVLWVSQSLAQDDGGGFFGRLLQGIQVSAARASWQSSVEPEVQSCLLSQYNINPSDLADQGILPNDPRVAPDIDNCRQAIAQGAQAANSQQAEQDPAERQKELIAKYGKKFGTEIAAGNIDIGMNQDEVAEAWGNPDDRQQLTKGREKWVYGQDAVTFSHGKVAAVGH
jgi:hypothetical protein